MKNITGFLSAILAFVIGIFTFPVSFLPSEADTDFTVITGTFTENKMTVNGNDTDIILNKNGILDENGAVSVSNSVRIEISSPYCDWFNYYGLSYTSDSYIKGTIEYKTGVSEKKEEFFLEPCDTANSFYSFIDGYLDKVKANAVCALTFECLDTQEAVLKIHGFSTFNREVYSREIYIENSRYKLGADLLWGGALSYLEDLDSDVEAVSVDGVIRVDSNASGRYGTEAVNSNVNLINRYDPGRLVQQSYYGTTSGEYECGEYMGNVWPYNPVQGGNQFGDSSKIVDIVIGESSLYIKSRPLDWAKSKECITPSYMESTYEFVGNTVHISCRFVDFSGYGNTEMRPQEIPAFYCIEPLNNFIYYGGNEPWTGGELSTVDDLIFWPDAGYPHYYSLENWAAFIGEFTDSFGIGVYVENETEFLTGVYNRGTTSDTDPSKSVATSYIAVTKNRVMKDFEPFEYDFYLTTGNASEIRNNFYSVKN